MCPELIRGSLTDAIQSGDTAMLENVPLFDGLSDEDLKILETHARRKTYRKNTIVVEKGDDTTSLFILLSGEVKVFITEESGKEVVLGTQGTGDYFGELSVLSGTERTASVMTQDDCKFLVFTKSSFLECLRDHPQIALNLIQKLINDVKKLTDRVTSLALQDVYGRVANVLREVAREEDGKLITARLTQQEIAQMVGSSREMISRIFKDLKLGGYIAIENKQIILKKKLPARW